MIIKYLKLIRGAIFRNSLLSSLKSAISIETDNQFRIGGEYTEHIFFMCEFDQSCILAIDRVNVSKYPHNYRCLYYIWKLHTKNLVCMCDCSRSEHVKHIWCMYVRVYYTRYLDYRLSEISAGQVAFIKPRLHSVFALLRLSKYALTNRKSETQIRIRSCGQFNQTLFNRDGFANICIRI